MQVQITYLTSEDDVMDTNCHILTKDTEHKTVGPLM